MHIRFGRAVRRGLVVLAASLLAALGSAERAWAQG